MVKYGFQYLETPSFEYTESIGKFLPDKERPGEGVFSFKDENKWLSLRYDLTAPLTRNTKKNPLHTDWFWHNKKHEDQYPKCSRLS